MSKAAKTFFYSSIALTGLTVWGVHFLQKAEYDNMYQGVIKDEARTRAKAASTPTSSTSSSQPSIEPVPIPTRDKLERQSEYERNLSIQRELVREQGEGVRGGVVGEGERRMEGMVGGGNGGQDERLV